MVGESSVLSQRYGPEISYIGKGTFGRVAHHRVEGKDYAIKIDTGDQDYIYPFYKEASILSKLDHPNVIPLVDFHLSNRESFLVFPYVKSVGFVHPRRDVYHLASALNYIHSLDIIHRDVKPSNTIPGENHLYLIDFGSAAPLNCSNPSLSKRNLVITPWYRPIELFFGKRIYGSEVDIWSLGCTIYYFLTGHHLFSGESDEEIVGLITQTLGDPRPEWGLGSVQGHLYLRDSIHTLNDPSRIFEDILEAGYSSEETGAWYWLIRSCLEYDPEKRATARQILQNPLFKTFRGEEAKPKTCLETLQHFKRTLKPVRDEKSRSEAFEWLVKIYPAQIITKYMIATYQLYDLLKARLELAITNQELALSCLLLTSSFYEDDLATDYYSIVGYIEMKTEGEGMKMKEIKRAVDQVVNQANSLFSTSFDFNMAFQDIYFSSKLFLEIKKLSSGLLFYLSHLPPIYLIDPEQVGLVAYWMASVYYQQPFQLEKKVTHPLLISMTFLGDLKEDLPHTNKLFTQRTGLQPKKVFSVVRSKLSKRFEMFSRYLS